MVWQEVGHGRSGGGSNDLGGCGYRTRGERRGGKKGRLEGGLGSTGCIGV